MISPNAVGFQFVVSCIARRVRKKGRKNASSIIIDQQHQFNKAQVGTHYNLARIAEGIKKAPHKDRSLYLNHPLYATLDKADIVHEGLPEKELTICRSKDSIGLQIVDVYLWIANKLSSGEDLPNELKYLWSLFSKRSSIDGISLQGMSKRFMEFERMLPKFEDLTHAQRELAKDLVEKHRSKVRSLR